MTSETQWRIRGSPWIQRGLLMDPLFLAIFTYVGWLDAPHVCVFGMRRGLVVPKGCNFPRVVVAATNNSTCCGMCRFTRFPGRPLRIRGCCWRPGLALRPLPAPRCAWGAPLYCI